MYETGWYSNLFSIMVYKNAFLKLGTGDRKRKI